MSGERDEDRSDDVTGAAAGWFARLADEAATGDDWLAFERWLAASPAHAPAYERIERIWLDLDDAGDEARRVLDLPVSLADHRAGRLSRRGWLGLSGAIAASVAIAAVGVAHWPQATTTTFRTAMGETRQVTLGDGTRVWLNAGSRIDVRLERRVRRVQMADAEAAFDVVHDPARPFVISVGDREVKVVGTEFNLRRRAGEMTLTVRRGVVEVRPATSPEANPTRVAAGQQLTHREGTSHSVLAAAQPDSAFAWTQGQLVYTDAPMSQVAADLSRSLGEPVRLADEATARLRFSGVLMLDDRAAALRRLQAFAPVEVERDSEGVILRRRRP